MPAQHIHVAIYITSLLDSKRTVHTISSAVYSIKWAHDINGLEDPTNNAFVNNLLESAKRLRGSKTKKKDILYSEMIIEYYFTGKRKLQILHTRIRTGCSSLNFDLFSKNIVDSPLCTCGSGNIENADHFFLRCPLYIDQRTELTSSILLYTTMTLNVLLSGDESLPHNLNVAIFDSVQKYILATKRFSSNRTR